MRAIKELASLSANQPQKGDKRELYALAVNKNYSKEKAILHFRKKQKEGQFATLYKRLKDDLLDGVLQYKGKGLSKVLRDRFKLFKRHLQTKMLLQADKKIAGVKYAIETIVTAEKQNQLEVVQSLSRELVAHFSSVDPNTKLYYKYKSKLEQATTWIREEMLAESVYRDLNFCTKKRKDINHISDSIKVLDKIAVTNNNYKFQYFYYSIKNIYAQSIGDDSELISNNRAAYNYFNNNPSEQGYVTKMNFLISIIPVYIKNKQFLEAEKVTGICLDLPPVGSFNWHMILLVKANLGLSSQKEAMSIGAYRNAHKVKKEFVSSDVDNSWLLYKGYLAFYHKLGLVNTPEFFELPDSDKTPNKFKLGKYLNSFKAGKDEVALKTNMLIVELLHLLADKNKTGYSKVLERIEPFILSNLRAQKYQRTRHFLRLLKTIEKGDYHPMRVKGYAQKYLLQMRNFKRLDIDLEVVPYEVLWERVLGMVKR